MLSQMPAVLEARAERVAALFEAEGYEVSVRAVESHAGGGSLPGEAIADFAVALRDQSLRADALHATLRSADPPIVTRVADGEVLLHMLAVSDDDVRLIESALTRLVP
jgi:L-seryl-tRNA(Ser) seleniumtransferase